MVCVCVCVCVLFGWLLVVVVLCVVVVLWCCFLYVAYFIVEIARAESERQIFEIGLGFF